MPAPLDYATPRSEPRSDRVTRYAAVICIAFTVVTLQTTARVEYLNVRAGNPLPFPASMTGKWRRTPIVDETSFRYYGNRLDPTLMSRPLSPAEREEIRRHVALNRLRDVVGSWGLLQYLLVPAALLVCAAAVLQRRPALPTHARVVAAVCGALNLLAGASMLHRGYFSSLGI